MMLGFPPPLFFQICWRFVSPAIIFVSSRGVLPAPAAPWLSVLSGTSRARAGKQPPSQSPALGMRGLDSQTCAHSEVLGPAFT